MLAFSPISKFIPFKIIDFPATVKFGTARDVHNIILATIDIQESVNPGVYTIHFNSKLHKIPEEMDVVLRVIDSEPIPNYYLSVDYYYHTIDDKVKFIVGKEDSSILSDNYTYGLSVYQGPYNSTIYPENIYINKDKNTATFEVPAKDLNVHKYYVENNGIVCNLFLIDKDKKEHTTNSLTYVSLISKDDIPDPTASYTMLNYPQINKKVQSPRN